MPDIAQTGDLTRNNNGLDRMIDTYRPAPNGLYTPGLTVKFLSLDQQQYPDMKTIGTPSLAAAQQLMAGIVSDTWPGLNGAVAPALFTAPSNIYAQRGSAGVDVVIQGPHPAAFVDQSGTGATAITNETTLVPSRATAGYLQGIATAVGGLGTVAVAMLAAATTLSAGALVQASQTDTIAGAPAVGDTLSVTVPVPFTTANPGVAQNQTFTTPPLTAAQAVSATTAAAALVAYLNSQAAFSTFYVASNAAGVVTIAVNTLASPFQYTLALNGALSTQYSIGLSGSAANGFAFSVSSTGGSTSTAGGATLAGGAGFKGTIPVFVV